MRTDPPLCHSLSQGGFHALLLEPDRGDCLHSFKDSRNEDGEAMMPSHSRRIGAPASGVSPCRATARHATGHLPNAISADRGQALPRSRHLAALGGRMDNAGAPGFEPAPERGSAPP